MNTKKRGYIGNAIAELPNSALLLLWAGMTFGFAIAYWLIGLIAPEHGPTIAITVHPMERFLDSLYFSIITATSVGFGDIVPQGFSRVLTSMQAIVSLSTFAILVTKLVSQKQEHMAENTYRLASEETAHTILDELHLVRQDLDLLRTHLLHSKELIDPQWHDLEIAFSRAQAAFLDIPALYEQEKVVTVSERRENLLIEGVERTLIRMHQFLHALNTHAIQPPAHIRKNIESFFMQTKRFIAEWETLLRKKNRHVLEGIRRVIRSIKEGTPPF